MRFGDGAPIGGGQGEHLAVGVDIRASFGGVGEEGCGEQEEKGMLLKHGCTWRARVCTGVFLVGGVAWSR